MGERAVIGELDIYGVYVPIFVVVATVAFLLQILLKRVLDACGLYRFLWHRALFDLAIYVILLGLVTAAAASILPLI
jgi:protein AaeX